MGALVGEGPEECLANSGLGILDNADGVDGSVLILEVVGHPGGSRKYVKEPSSGVPSPTNQPSPRKYPATNRQGGRQSSGLFHCTLRLSIIP